MQILAQHGELVQIDGADPNTEIGALYDVIEHQPDAPAVLFDHIRGYAPGHRLLTNFLGSALGIGLVLNMPERQHKLDFVTGWRGRMRSAQPIPPRLVCSSPVLENVQTGEDVNLLDFPAPIWHEGDGGPFIGTACAVITRDPDTGAVNLGTHRGQVLDRDTLGCLFSDPSKHGYQHALKYHRQGKPCPIAVVLGCDPLLFLVAATYVRPDGHGEYGYAGAMRGAPIDVFESDLTGLPLPASAEVVVEGEYRLDEQRVEGPFGEWTGYYGNPAELMPVIKIKRILYRNNPIILGKPPIRPPSGWDTCKSIKQSADIWDRMEQAGVPDVRGVWCHEVGGGRFFNVVAIKQRYPGHARQAALIASQCGEAVRSGRYTIVVDDDIDPADLEQVVWAVSTRTDPEQSIDIVRRTLSTKLDPMLKPGDPVYTSRAIIDACRPFERLGDFAAVIDTDPARIAAVKQKWGHLLTRGKAEI